MSGVKKFKVTYTNAARERLTEEPRLMISVDGKHKSLFLGDKPIASVPYDAEDADLWNQARTGIAAQ